MIFKKKEETKGEPFECSKLKLLLKLLNLKQYKNLSIREIADLIGENQYLIFKMKGWLIQEGVLKHRGTKIVEREQKGKIVEYEADSYDIDKERIDSIIFDKWETRILFDRADEYFDRPEYKNL